MPQNTPGGWNEFLPSPWEILGRYVSQYSLPIHIRTIFDPIIPHYWQNNPLRHVFKPHLCTLFTFISNIMFSSNQLRIGEKEKVLLTFS